MPHMWAIVRNPELEKKIIIESRRKRNDFGFRIKPFSWGRGTENLSKFFSKGQSTDFEIIKLLNRMSGLEKWRDSLRSSKSVV